MFMVEKCHKTCCVLNFIILPIVCLFVYLIFPLSLIYCKRFMYVAKWLVLLLLLLQSPEPDLSNEHPYKLTMYEYVLCVRVLFKKSLDFVISQLIVLRKVMNNL